MKKEKEVTPAGGLKYALVTPPKLQQISLHMEQIIESYEEDVELGRVRTKNSNS